MLYALSLPVLVLILITGLSAASCQDKETFHTDGMPVIFDDDVNPGFKDNVNLALDYLRDHYPDNYTSVTRWLTEIRPTGTFTRVNNKGICYIDRDDANASYIWLAGVLIHEARHVEDDNTYFISAQYSPEESERRALYSQASFQASVNGWTGEETEDWAEEYLKTRYWETITASYA